MTTAEEPLAEEHEVFLKRIQKKALKHTSQRDLILDVFLWRHLQQLGIFRDDKHEGAPTVRLCLNTHIK